MTAIRAPAGRPRPSGRRTSRARRGEIEVARLAAARASARSRAPRGVAGERRRLGRDRLHLVESAVAMEHDVAAGRERRARALGERARTALPSTRRRSSAARRTRSNPRITCADHCGRSGGRRDRIDGGEHNMRGHPQRQARRAAGTPRNRSPPASRGRRRPPAAAAWLSAVARPWPGMCLSTGSTPPSIRPSATAPAIAATLLGRVAIGAVADHRVGAGDRHVGERQAIDVDAERAQDRWRSAARRAARPQARPRGRGRRAGRRRRPADRPASAAARAAARGRPPGRPAPAHRPADRRRGTRQPAGEPARASSMLRLNRIRPQGAASRRKARSSGVMSVPARPVMKARAVIGAAHSCDRLRQSASAVDSGARAKRGSPESITTAGGLLDSGSRLRRARNDSGLILPGGNSANPRVPRGSSYAQLLGTTHWPPAAL